MMTLTMSYKQLHEDFVSNLSGTTLWEIQGLAALAVFSSLLRDLLVWNWPALQQMPVLRFLLDFSVLVLSIVLCLTVLSGYWELVLLSLVVVTLAVCVLQITHSYPRVEGNLLQTEITGSRRMVTNMRGSLLVSTAIAILAVDFVVFPRRFAKVETYGTGLMDAGVGMFTVLMGLVSREARSTSASFSASSSSRLSHMGYVVKSSAPLMVFGFLRLIMVKSADYQEHVTEYGLHWNFFFTLAVVRVLSASVVLVWNSPCFWVLAVSCGTFYQSLLSFGGLTQNLLHGFYGDEGRHGIFDSNREGMASSLGYIAIYWAGVFIGQRFFLIHRKTVKAWLSFIGQLLVGFIIVNVLLALCQNAIEPISRRFANLPYILWVISMLIQLVGSCVVEELIMTVVYARSGSLSKDVARGQGGCLMSAVNYNGLAFFVFSNLLTGIINKLLPTIHTSSSQAIIIITLYMFVLTLITFVMYIKKIRLKC